MGFHRGCLPQDANLQDKDRHGCCRAPSQIGSAQGFQPERRIRGDLKCPNLSAGSNTAHWWRCQKREQKELLQREWKSLSSRLRLESERTLSSIVPSSLSSRTERIKSLFLLARSQN